MPRGNKSGESSLLVYPNSFFRITKGLLAMLIRPGSVVMASPQASGKRILVRTAAVDHGNRDFQQPQIDRELSAMMVPVIHHDRADHTGTRLGEDFSVSSRQSPWPSRGFIAQSFQARLSVADTFFERIHQL